MTVYILFHETNTGHSDESDGYVEAVYLHEADAEAARLAAIRAAEEEDVHWSHDWSVHTWPVSETADLPTEGFFAFLVKA